MTAVRYTVPGEPVAAERPRTVTLPNGRRSTFTPKATRDAEDQIGWTFRQAAPRWRPGAGEYRLTILFYLRTHRRKDMDNLLKTVMDGLNHVAWDDDSQVRAVDMRLIRGSPNPRTVIEVREMSPERGTPVDRPSQ